MPSRSAPPWSRVSVILFFIISFLAISSFAQAPDNNNNNNNNKPAAPAPTPGAAQPAPASTADPASKPASSDPPASSASDSATSSAPPPPPLTSSTSSTSSDSSSSSNAVAPLPTISGILPPPLIVPDTSRAPFMQRSNLPEGTVFIAVGAILGFFGLAILAWRGLVAWSLHRNVKKAARTTYAPTSDSKSTAFALPTMNTPGHKGYSSMYHDSNMSLDQLTSINTKYDGAGAGTGSPRRGSRHMDGSGRDRPKYRNSSNPALSGDRVSRDPTASGSLFFSPTANPSSKGAGQQQTQSSASNNRNSYMPAGFYAGGAALANSGEHIAHFGDDAKRLSRGGYNRVSTALDSTPPESPSFRPTSMRPSSSSGTLGGPTAASSGYRRHSAHQSLGADMYDPPPRAKRSSHQPSRSGHETAKRSSYLGNDGTHDSPKRASRAKPDRRREYTPSPERPKRSSAHLDVGAPPKGRTPSAYLEDLFENHGSGMRER